MGTPIPNPPVFPPVAPGLACPLCWGPGKPFGDSLPPIAMIVQISGVNKGPDWDYTRGEPINGTFVLTQTVGNSCSFEWIAGRVTMLWENVATLTRFSVRNDELSITFYGNSYPECASMIVNEQHNNFIGGTAVVNWGNIL